MVAAWTIVSVTTANAASTTATVTPETPSWLLFRPRADVITLRDVRIDIRTSVAGIGACNSVELVAGIGLLADQRIQVGNSQISE